MRGTTYGFKSGSMKPTKAEGSRGYRDLLKIRMNYSQWVDTVTDAPSAANKTIDWPLACLSPRLSDRNQHDWSFVPITRTLCKPTP